MSDPTSVVLNPESASSAEELAAIQESMRPILAAAFPCRVKHGVKVALDALLSAYVTVAFNEGEYDAAVSAITQMLTRFKNQADVAAQVKARARMN